MIVDFIDVELSAITVEQQASITVTVLAYDAFGNPIPVPSSARVDATGRGTVESTGLGTWKVTTLDSGPQTITVSAGQVSENLEIEVTGTFGGFFAAGGTLYYMMMTETTIMMTMMMMTNLVLLVVQPAQHQAQVVRLRVRVDLHQAQVHQVLLLKKRKRRKIPVGLSIVELMMMEPNGRKAKMKHGTTENLVKVIGTSGRIR